MKYSGDIKYVHVPQIDGIPNVDLSNWPPYISVSSITIGNLNVTLPHDYTSYYSFNYGKPWCSWSPTETLLNIVWLDEPYIRLPQSALLAYAAAIGLNITDKFIPQTLTYDQYMKLQPLTFHFGNVSVTLNRDAQIISRKYNHILEGYTNATDILWAIYYVSDESSCNLVDL